MSLDVVAVGFDALILAKAQLLPKNVCFMITNHDVINLGTRNVENYMNYS